MRGSDEADELLKSTFACIIQVKRNMTFSRVYKRMHKNKEVTIYALFILSFGVLYGGILRQLVGDWSADSNYSHGFIIIPIALYLVWERREKLLAADISLKCIGVPIFILSLIITIMDMHPFINRIAMLMCMIGCMIVLWGWHRIKIISFPICFLLLMIPIPAIILNQITFPLQLISSNFAELFLSACQIPVLREGNIIRLTNTSLEVTDACSGVRSLISLLTLGIVYGYFRESHIWVRVALAFATIPIAIMANGIRIAGTGLATQWYGAEAAKGFFHSFSGWLVFCFAFIILMSVHQIINWRKAVRYIVRFRND
jgi:exosortase